jgi:hypothetical protein
MNRSPDASGGGSFVLHTTLGRAAVVCRHSRERHRLLSRLVK